MYVIDIHAHPIPNIVKPENLVAIMDKLKIKKMVLLAIDIGPEDMKNGKLEANIYKAFQFTSIGNIPKLVLEARKFIEFASTPNEYVYNFTKIYPKRFVGFGSISPYRKITEILSFFKMFDEYGFKGLKVIPTLQQFDPEKNENFEVIWSKAHERNYAILAHTGFDPGPWEYFPLSIIARPSRYEKLIAKYDNPVILAHAGSYSAYYPGLWHNEALELVSKYEHVYMDVSAVFYLTRDEKVVKKWRDLSIMDKVLFGSDYPAVEGLTLHDSIDLVKSSPVLTQKEKEMILYKNSEKLFHVLKV